MSAQRMPTRARAAACIALALQVVLACDREHRRFAEAAPGAAPADTVPVSSLLPGASNPLGQPGSPYLENAWAISEGKRLYQAFNCVGCHAHGGGGMGPPLMDHKWIYGSDPAQIHASIVQGRPNGMPTFGARITEQQAWQLTAYVRSLSGMVPKDAAGGRSDHMQVKPSEQSMPESHPRWTGTPP